MRSHLKVPRPLPLPRNLLLPSPFPSPQPAMVPTYPSLLPSPTLLLMSAREPPLGEPKACLSVPLMPSIPSWLCTDCPLIIRHCRLRNPNPGGGAPGPCSEPHIMFWDLAVTIPTELSGQSPCWKEGTWADRCTGGRWGQSPCSGGRRALKEGPGHEERSVGAPPLGPGSPKGGVGFLL